MHGTWKDGALSTRASLSSDIRQDAYNCMLYISRAKCHEDLGYPELASFDAYKALMLLDLAMDDSEEYHELALHAFCVHFDIELSPNDHVFQKKSAEVRREITLLITRNLITIGCLRSAYMFAAQFLRISEDGEVQTLIEEITTKAKMASIIDQGITHKSDGAIDIQSLPDSGYVRREVYSWNKIESDRVSSQSVTMLNEGLREIAPKLEVKAVELPVLQPNSAIKVERQLGLFAKEDIDCGEEILCERSLLTGNARLHEPLCDACNTVLPSLQSNNLNNAISKHDSDRNIKVPVPCGECDDTVFCSQICHDLAQKLYHPALCSADVDAISEDILPAKAADALYSLLLLRALAMSLTQDKHALELAEVRNICGEFVPALSTEDSLRGASLFQASHCALPFSFEDNVMTPLHMLEKMNVDVFASPHDIAELWVWNTLFAKFRATASARISTRDGRPEVAAVHPFWCLANHSCDPNVEWEWAGEIRFNVRKGRIAWKRPKDGQGHESIPSKASGVRAGEEILNHYVDIDLPVQQRREWGVGALGGPCRCDRCIWEARES